MIISELTGGLGNQMFQYAFGYALSRKKSFTFKYHFINHPNNTPRSFELNHLRITAKKAGIPDLEQVGYPTSIIKSALTQLRLHKPSILNEDNIDIRTPLDFFQDNYYIRGYWQSEKYFLDYSNEIRQQFIFKELLKDKNARLEHKMKNSKSVAVHVRRGDYVTNKTAFDYHGLCSVEYYKSAMNFVESKIKHPIYFFFSDDQQWVKSNLKSKSESYYVDWNKGASSFHDMHLMSLCKHNIIANSSFSWWGAWLNSNKDKIVCAPNKWTNKISKPNLLPAKWNII